MRYDFLVFGADGMQGKIVARDLLENGYKVLLSDLYKVTLKKLLGSFGKRAAFAPVDLRDIDRTISVIQKSGADVVVNCAEGDWNLNVYKACLQTQTHCLDLGSHADATKKQLEMHEGFKKIGRTAITGCGSVPGIGNVMLRWAAAKFDSIHTVEAGFAWNSNIRKFVVPFSIESIMEEFTSLAPYIKNGRWYKKMPLDTVEHRFFRSIGTQPVFIADHAETYTFHHYYKSKGLKNVTFWAGFPEHSSRVIQGLIDLTFHEKEHVKFNGSSVQPDEFLAQMLKRLKMPRGYREKENLWVLVRGAKSRRRKTILMECLVPTLDGWEDAGCNIDTGLPASIVAQMIKKSVIKNRGSFAPEGVVPPQKFFRAIKKRKMLIYANGKPV